MKDSSGNFPTQEGTTRRTFLWTALVGSIGILYGPWLFRRLKAMHMRSETFIEKASHYTVDFASIIKTGFRELGIKPTGIKDKRILLKPNIVETHQGLLHINTHPMVLRGAIEAFMSYGAAEVLVAEGPGHCRDVLLLLEESGVAEILKEDRIRFVDLNFDQIYTIRNKGRRSRLTHLILPETIRQSDWIVSMAKMKTHHWTGVTLTMKNLFGIMPGSYYGWPKNVLHWAGIHETILDINTAIQPQLAIVDGVVGMEGDGPIMGTPRQSGVLVMGRECLAVDATSARIMGIDPYKIPYMKVADGRLGSIREQNIRQRGQSITAVQSRFNLLEKIPAHREIYL